jgi:hypothetical protein
MNSRQIAENLQTLQTTQISQSSTQKSTYAQKAAQFANANVDKWNLMIKKTVSKSQEISYHERRFIITLKNDNWILKTIKMWNSMNNALKNAKINLLIVTVIKTQKKNNIVLMILNKYTTEALLAQRAIWKHVFKVKSINKDEKWHKIIIHSLKIKIFNMKIEIKNLKIELKSFNSKLKLIINSIWLFTSETRS